MKHYACLFAVIALLLSGNAFSDDKDKAKDHFLKGKALVEAGSYDKAIVELEASYDLNPFPIVLYNMALCYDELHQYADALKNYRKFLALDKNATEELRIKVTARIKKLNKFIGLLKLEVDIKGAEVLIDNKLVGHTPAGVIPVETGVHDLTIRKTGYPDIKKKVKIISGQTTELSFSVEKESSKEDGENDKALTRKKEEKEEVEIIEHQKAKEKKKLSPAPFWAMVGLTGATTLAAIVTGALAIQKDGQVGDYYEDEREEVASAKDDRRTLALTTDVLIGVSVAGAATAVILYFFTDFKKEKKKKLSFMPVTDGKSFLLGYEGTF